MAYLTGLSALGVDQAVFTGMDGLVIEALGQGPPSAEALAAELAALARRMDPLAQALGDRRGIHRFGHFVAPLDEALVQVALDCSGRPHISYGLKIPAQKIGSYDTELVKEFFVAVANNAGLTLHIRQLDGVNSHHIVEACFKAFARALRLATEIDPRRAGAVPSSKGVLEQAGG